MFSRRHPRLNRGRVAAGVVTSPWDPSQIPDLVLDLNADLGITLNGSAVSAWADQSGNGNHFVQATASVQPNYSASDANMNGHAAVICDVPDNVLTCANSITIAWLAVVAYYPATTFTSFDGLFTQAVQPLLRGSSGSANWRVEDLTANRWRDGVSTATALTTANQVHLYEIEPASAMTASTWRLGRDPNNTGRQWRGGITRILAASSMPSSGVRSQLLGYSQAEYTSP